MSFTDWGPFREMGDLTSEVNDFMGNFPLSILNRYATPRTDVYQTDKEVIVKSEVPGVKREDIEILIENSYIRLSGQKKRIKTKDNEEIYRSEQFYGSFSRIIPLPSEVEPIWLLLNIRMVSSQSLFPNQIINHSGGKRSSSRKHRTPQ